MEKLSEEVRKRIEHNKAQAIARRQQKDAERAAQQKTLQPVIPTFSNSAPRTAPFVNKASSFFGSTRPEKLSQAVSTFRKAQQKPKTGANAKSSGAVPKEVSGLCFLLSSDEFRLQCGYNSKLDELFKNYPSSRLDPTTRNYCFKLEFVESVLKRAKEIAPGVIITGLPPFIPKMLRRNPRKKENIVDLNTIDPKLRKALMPFQIEGVVRGISQHGKILIADDMGLGKTVQGLAIASFYREEWPLLIICPSSMRFNWKQALLYWLPSLTEADIQVIIKTTEPLDGNQVVITSYDLMARRSNDLLCASFKVVIFDESHFLKNYKSQRTKTALEISSNARRIILLSGTPALSRPIELFPQIQCLAPKHLPVVHDFALRYCNAHETRFGWDYNGSSYLDELQILLTEVLMIRRLKKDVLDQLPAKQRSVLILDPTLVPKKSVEAESYSQALQMENVKKKAVCKYVEELLESDCKFLVFAHHQVMLEAIAEVLEKKKAMYIRIDGKVSSEARELLCQQFQTKEACRVALLSITAANAGLTLHAATLVVFAELFWNPGILTQAEDRIHRIGQKQTCLVTYLIAKDTADDYIWPIIESKLSVLNQAGLAKESFSDAMQKKVEQKAKDELPSEVDHDIADQSGKSLSKRQKTMRAFIPTSNDSCWMEFTQDTQLHDL